MGVDPLISKSNYRMKSSVWLYVLMNGDINVNDEVPKCRILEPVLLTSFPW